MSPQSGPAIERAFPDPHQLANGVAATIAAQLRAAIEARGQALLAVSGGRSPQPVFAQLAEAPLAWQTVTVALVDERWVGPEHADSNERLVRTHLLVGQAARARLLPMKNAQPDPESGQAECEAALRTLALPFDLIVLGMGDDGHTASLFPGAPGLSAALSADGPGLCVAMRPPHAPHARMSLSLHALLQSRRLLLPLAGRAKLAAYRQALGPGAVADMPIRALLRQRTTPLEVWYSETD